MTKEKLTTEEIKNEMLLRTDNDGRTPWHFAALFGQQDILKDIWNWAKEQLTTEEIRNEMLLRTDNS
jgi:endo-1,4-beta-D-glucanase Y